MGESRRRRIAAAASGALPRAAIATSIRSAVVETAKRFGATGGFCAFHAAVGQRILEDRFGLSVAVVAGDLQRAINPEVVHSHAVSGGRIDAETGACHVWLVETATQSVIDFDAWEEPVRYELAGAPHGPWVAPRPDFYWTDPGKPRDGLAKVIPDRRATEFVLSRLTMGTTALFVATAVAKAQEFLDMLPL